MSDVFNGHAKSNKAVGKYYIPITRSPSCTAGSKSLAASCMRSPFIENGMVTLSTFTKKYFNDAGTPNYTPCSVQKWIGRETGAAYHFTHTRRVHEALVPSKLRKCVGQEFQVDATKPAMSASYFSTRMIRTHHSNPLH